MPSQRVQWMPTWGEERISNMIATRPDWCISRQRVWGVPIIVFYCDKCREPLTDRKILDGIVALFREHTRGRLVRTHGGRTAARRHRLRQVRRRGIQQGERHSGRVVRFRLQPPGGAQRALRPHLAGRYVHRRRRPVSRLVPQLAAGGHGAERRVALPRLRTERLGAGWRGQGDAQVAGQLHRARRGDQASRRGDPAAVVRVGGFQRRRALVRDHSDAAYRRLSQAAQHVPLHAGQPYGLRSGDRPGARRRTAGARPVDPAARRRPGGQVPRLVSHVSSSTRCITPSTLSLRWT